MTQVDDYEVARKSRRWKRIRREQLRRQPLCVFCEKKGKIVPAAVADHIAPHRHNMDAFWSSELQSLCASCHSGSKQQVEKRGYATDIGAVPIDVKHPLYKQRDGGG
jgi:5-methylcytosine-specific restriction enzyme A